MATIGKFCKAYHLEQFRRFPGWKEDVHNARKVKVEINGQAEEMVRELSGEDFLYLQENFTVTDGIFFDENIIFNDVTPEWIEFCETTLEFQVPADEADANEEVKTETPSGASLNQDRGAGL